MTLLGIRSGKKDFEFAHLKPMNVCFGESVAFGIGNEGSGPVANVHDVIEWLHKYWQFEQVFRFCFLFFKFSGL